MAAKITARERHLFIENMFSKLENVPIDTIIGLRIRIKPNGRHMMGLCPFHNDLHYGSFIVTPSKNLWKCFACGDGYGGNGIKFISLYDGIDYLQAAFKVALELRFISFDDYELYANQTYDKKYVTRLEKKYDTSSKTCYKESPKASFDICHNIYKAMKAACTLSEEHHRQLSETRHLPEERISSDYFTFPAKSYQKNKVIKLIREQYPEYTDEVLMTVPGFYYDKRYNKVSFYGTEGIAFLIHDTIGRVAAIQIRRDNVKEGQSRYTWFSSSFAMYDSDKYMGGASPGAPIDVLYPENTDRSILCITEGRFKSEVIRTAGNLSMSLQGVGSWRGIDKAINEVMETRSVRQIFLMFDSDMFGKPEVFTQLHKLATALSSAFPGIRIRIACWPIAGGKGIDDLFINGNISTVQYKEFDALCELYKSVLQSTLECFEYEKIRDIPDEQKAAFADTLQAAEENAILSA